MSLISNKFQSEFWASNGNARGYDHPVVKAFVTQRLDWLRGQINFAAVRSVFDVGCGDGFATYYFDKEFEDVQGGDMSALMLDRNPVAREKLRIIDAQKMDLPDNSFDLMYAWEVMHHLERPRDAVAEMVRVAKKYVVIFEPNRDHILQALFGLAVKHERGILRSNKEFTLSLADGLPVKVKACSYSGRIPPNKTPTSWLPYLMSLPFEAERFTGISIGLILEKVTVS